MNIDTLKQIALDAGKIVKEGYASHKEVSHKGIVDLVTEYDVKTESFIKIPLAKLLGDGRLALFGPEILFRGQPHATFKLVFNGIVNANVEAAAGEDEE